MMIKRTVRPIVLVILDGLGYRTQQTYNAVALASTPTLDMLLDHYPHAIIKASGDSVGLPPGYIGNSEVGHLTIGAGRIIPQALVRINNAIQDTSFFSHPHLKALLEQCAHTNNTLHIMGLLSDAGVHSHTDHLYAYLQTAEQHGIKRIVVHAFLDGRDVPPQSARAYLTQLQTYIDTHPNVTLGSIHGRYYAMDRDKHWDRTDQSINVLTTQHEPQFSTWSDALDYYYANETTDEFIPPTSLSAHATIQPNDCIIFFNYRPDRARQLLSKLTEQTQTNILTSVKLNHFGPSVTCLLSDQPVRYTLQEILNTHQKTMFSIAETEKYAHITYFFNGGKEALFPYETRILIPSIPARNYVDHPAMSAEAITKSVMQSLKHAPCDFYVINYANPDMVGHSGNLQATIKAVECIDAQLALLYNKVVNKLNGTLIVTADHGNAEDMFDEAAQQPKTSHTTNPVPFIVAQQDLKDSGTQLTVHELKDIAPYILRIMHLPVPEEMITN